MFCRIRVVTGPSTYLLAQLHVGDVDFVVGRLGNADGMTGLSFEHLYSECIVLAVRAGHPLLHARPFDLRQVERYPILMPPPGAIIRPSVQRFLLSHGVGKLRDEVETVSNSLGRAIVMASDAVWIISEGVVAGDIAEGRLAALPVDTRETLGPIGITTRTGMALSPHAEALIRIIRSVAAERGTAG
jgi:LysR family pca operon transcriptional activator